MFVILLERMDLRTFTVIFEIGKQSVPINRFTECFKDIGGRFGCLAHHSFNGHIVSYFLLAILLNITEISDAISKYASFELLKTF